MKKILFRATKHGQKIFGAEKYLEIALNLKIRSHLRIPLYIIRLSCVKENDE
jgi:hypothetical protein